MRWSTFHTTWYRIIPALSALGVAASAQAMSYVPMTDTPLLDQAGVVVLGTVTGAAPAPGHALDATRYSLAVEQTLKGAAAQSVGILTPGAQDPAQPGALNIPGTPHLAVGERVLVFLEPRADGDYVLVHLSLGAFHVRASTQGSQLLLRDLEQADALEASSGTPAATAARPRDLGKFLTWLRRKSTGQAAADNYWSDETVAPVLQPRFAVPSPPARWAQFDNGGSVPFYAGSTGQIGLPGGGYTEFQEAIAAWNATGRVRYAYAGLTNATGTPANPDGVNKIVFNDLGNFIGGVFDCLNGGVAGWGGWRSGPSVTANGITVQPIVEGDIVIRNGAGCLLSRNGNTDAAELFGHELGHTLGLNHPCGDSGEAACVPGTPQEDALMRPTIHGDGRGARLGSDDLAGIAYLYPRAATASGSSSSGGGGSSSSGGSPSGTGSSGGSSGSGGGGLFNPALLLALGIAAALRHRGALRRPAWLPVRW